QTAAALEADVAGFLGPGAVRALAVRHQPAQTLLRPAVRARQRIIRLNFREAFGRRRPEPSGVFETQAGEGEMRRAVPRQQGLDQWGFDVRRAQVLAGA